MIFLKIMDRMDFIMKSKECMNCGSTKFHQVENGWKCDYCGTLYLKQRKKTPEKPIQEPSNPQKKKTKILIWSVLSTIFVLIDPLSFLVTKINDTRTPTYEPIKPNAENSGEKTEFPGEWTSSIYDSVKVATENYDADNEKYSFTGGSSYEELEKLVGPPDTVTSWEKEDYGMPPRAMATWNKLKNGEYTSHSITIHYDKKTMMITDKDHY
ncbi:hypothetical protein K5P74_01320 [Enterococcus raffinosus]|nr:hypothetical protein K5P74_01320 [Enterococcus raffinosus]